MSRKTTQQAFNNLKSELEVLRNEVAKSIPKALIKVGKASRKYMLLSIVFYILSMYMIYIGEYSSAIISSLMGFVFIR